MSNTIYKKIRAAVYLLVYLLVYLPIIVFFVLPWLVAVYAAVVFLFPLFVLACLLRNKDFEGFKNDMRETYVDMPSDFLKDVFSKCF